MISKQCGKISDPRLFIKGRNGVALEHVNATAGRLWQGKSNPRETSVDGFHADAHRHLFRKVKKGAGGLDEDENGGTGEIVDAQTIRVSHYMWHAGNLLQVDPVLRRSRLLICCCTTMQLFHPSVL
ncbi:hypothetical protein Y032_0100g3248 [Ancylostoma ceylanicum]|nr:hypothetical protein Y032_0100g3248 [Ancylostoma ceylanicum]